MRRFDSRPSRLLRVAVAVVGCATVAARAAVSAEPLRADLVALYEELHRHPELSGAETRTADRLAAWLRAGGFEVTTGVGGTGVVGVLRNGPGKVVLLRTELDALPIEEKTGLTYASVDRGLDAAGADVPVMHACGHDVHMTAWAATAASFAAARGSWRGTLVFVAQPAEELGVGARRMIEDGLFSRFPRPDYVLAFHDTAELPAGKVGFTRGYPLAAADSVDLAVFGRGGHAAKPQTTIDPVVIAARTVLSLQTIIARESDPLDPVVVTVGSIHGGTRYNIIPDQVQLQITVRTFREPVRRRVLEAIERISRAESAAAGAPRPPEMTIAASTPSTYNDPALLARSIAAVRSALGADMVVELGPELATDDFSEYSRAAGAASLLLRFGATEAALFRDAESGRATLPAIHSPRFAPDRDATIQTAITAERAVLLELLGVGRAAAESLSTPSGRRH